MKAPPPDTTPDGPVLSDPRTWALLLAVLPVGAVILFWIRH